MAMTTSSSIKVNADLRTKQLDWHMSKTSFRLHNRRTDSRTTEQVATNPCAAFHEVCLTCASSNCEKLFTPQLVEERLIVELKACRAVAPEHVAQMLGYLRSARMNDGLLLNFGS